MITSIMKCETVYISRPITVKNIVANIIIIVTFTVSE